MKARLEVMEKLGLVVDKYCTHLLQEEDEKRVQSANKRAHESTKEARKCRKRLRLEEAAKTSQKEGLVYAAGEF